MGPGAGAGSFVGTVVDMERVRKELFNNRVIGAYSDCVFYVHLPSAEGAAIGAVVGL